LHITSVPEYHTKYPIFIRREYVRMRASILGSIGSALAALCCGGVPVVLGVISAVGLGFLINDMILLPLVALSLGVAFWGLGRGVSRHRSPSVVVLGGEGAVFMVAGIFTQPLVIYTGIAALIGAALWNALVLQRT
jgi:mercuric ion transport protein